MSAPTVEELRERLKVLMNESYRCTGDVMNTYPAPQQHAERQAHLDWHRGYRAALRDVQKECERKHR